MSNMSKKTLEEEQQEAKNLVAKLRLVLSTLKENPEDSEPKLTATQVNDFVERAVKEFHNLKILTQSETIGQNRTACVEYLIAVIPFVIDEYFDGDSEHTEDMKSFLARFCFSPDNHLDRFCLASYLQKKRMLDKLYRPISEKVNEILEVFRELTGYSPYEKVPESLIEEFLHEFDERQNNFDGINHYLNLEEY